MSQAIPSRDELIERLTRRIAGWGMIAPTIVFLETYKPLAFFGAQILWTVEPFFKSAFQPDDLRDLASLMQDDEGIELLIEHLEAWQKNPPSSQAQS